MSLERGFRRILIVVSAVLLASAVLFSGALGSSLISSARNDAQRKEVLRAKGYDEVPSKTLYIGVTPLEARRWRVTVWYRHTTITGDDLRPLLVSPEFRNADREHRRVFLSASDADFAALDRSGQDTILNWVETIVPASTAPSSTYQAQLMVERAGDLPMHTWQVTSSTGERQWVDSPYELTPPQLQQLVRNRTFLPGVAIRRHDESARKAYAWTTIYVLTSDHDLTPIQVVRFAQAFKTPDLGSVYSPTPGIEVLSCDRESLSFGNTTSLFDWVMNQPKIAWILVLPFFVVVWLPFLSPGYTWPAWVYVAEMVIAPLLDALFAVGILWSLFYLIRWIVKGFSVGQSKERDTAQPNS
jgi:hypothetical protein